MNMHPKSCNGQLLLPVLQKNIHSNIYNSLYTVFYRLAWAYSNFSYFISMKTFYTRISRATASARSKA